MAGVHESAVSLRFLGDDLEPEEISDALGVRPDKGVRKGEVSFSPKGRPVIAHTGMWRLTTEREIPADLDKQITSLLARMTTDLHVWNEFSLRYGGHIWVSLMLKGSMEFIGIQPHVLSAVGDRGLAIEMNIVSGEDDDDFADAPFPIDGPVQ